MISRRKQILLFHRLQRRIDENERLINEFTQSMRKNEFYACVIPMSEKLKEKYIKDYEATMHSNRHIMLIDETT